MLTYDDSKHEYRMDGMRLPHVTQVLAPLVDYSAVGSTTLSAARQEGEAIHRMVEYHLTGRLDHVPSWLEPHFDQLQEFIAETGFILFAAEAIVCHHSQRYAGRLDLCGSIHGRRAIVDVKRTLFAGPVIGLQLAAYAAAVDVDVVGRGLLFKTADPVLGTVLGPTGIRLPASRQRTSDRFALRLDGKGKYKLEQYDDPADYSTYLAALQMHNWRTKHARTLAVNIPAPEFA